MGDSDSSRKDGKFVPSDGGRVQVEPRAIARFRPPRPELPPVLMALDWEEEDTVPGFVLETERGADEADISKRGWVS